MEDTFELKSLQPEIEKLKELDFTFRSLETTSPVYVGYYQHGDGFYTVKFNFTKKPNWFRRTAVRLLFDWKWVDINI